MESPFLQGGIKIVRLRLKCDGTRTETRFRLSAKRTSPFKSAGASVQSITGSRGVRISGSNAGCTMFRGSVKSTGHPLHSPVYPSLPLPCVTICQHISTGLYHTAGYSTNYTRLHKETGSDNVFRCFHIEPITVHNSRASCIGTLIIHSK
jgi:hypothetical protein